MKPHKESLSEFLDRSFARFRELPQPQVESACSRVLEKLRNESAGVGVEVRGTSALSRRRKLSRVAIAGAVVAGLLAAVLHNLFRPDAAVAGAVVQAEDGSLNPLPEGKIFRTGRAAGALLSLADGSRVEVRSQSELSFERAGGDFRIRLNDGSVVVNASEHRVGRLDVQTRDLIVTVSGTVFLVAAEETGSRVGVIQGNVRVRQGPAESTLRQGDQITTSPLMKQRAITEEFAWSRNADTHFDQLQQSRLTLQERCGSLDLRSIVRDNGWNLQLPGVLWRKYKCQHEEEGQ